MESPSLTSTPNTERGREPNLKQNTVILMNVQKAVVTTAMIRIANLVAMYTKLLGIVGGCWLLAGCMLQIPLHRKVQQVCAYSFEGQWAADPGSKTYLMWGL